MRSRHKKPDDKDSVTLPDNVKKQIPDSITHSHIENGEAVIVKTTLNIRTQQIAVGLPMDELMFSKFFANYIGLNLMPWDAVITVSSTYLPMARNQIHNAYLENGIGSHLLMLDSDVLPPGHLVPALLKHNLPIVGGWYRKKEKFHYKDIDGNPFVTQRPVVYDYAGGEKENLFSPRINPGKGLEKVGGMGAGCWLMSRRVAESLGKSPYDMNSGGEDLVICRKITKAGFDLYVDWSLACAHMGVFFV